MRFNIITLECCMQDELLWAATWLFKATKNQIYFKYITEEAIAATVAEFNWDLKYSGCQILLAEVTISLHHNIDKYIY